MIGLSILLAWLPVAAEDFVPLAVWFSGLSAAEARPIVERLFQALQVGIVAGPLVAILGWWVVQIIRRHLDFWSQPRVFAFCAVAVALLSFPNPVASTMPGLDASWKWALNETSLSGAVGRDFAFTYGPLGFLLFPQLPAGNVVLSLLSSTMCLALWTVLLVSLYRFGPRYRPMAWLLLATFLFPQENMEWRWIALSVVLTILPVVAPHLSHLRLVCVAAGIVLPFTWLMKFSAIAVGFSTLAVSVCLFLVKDIRHRRAILLIPLVAAGLSVVWIWALFDSLADLMQWMRRSLEIASGYNLYMTAGRSVGYLVFPFAVLVCAAVVVWRGCTRRLRLLTVALLFAPALFCATKYMLVRQGPSAFLYLLAICLAVLSARVPRLRRRIFLSIAGLFLVSQSFVLPRTIAGVSPSDFPFGLNPLGLVRTLRLPAEMEAKRRETESAVAACRLPETWRTAIGRERVAFLPHEFAPAMADRYEVTFLPTLQLYSAYLPSLDAACGAFLTSPRGPNWIVLDIDPEGCGHFMNFSQTWAAVFATFEVKGNDGERLLLRRRALDVPAGDAGNCSDERVVSVGDWIDCADFASRPLSVDWRQTHWGRFCAFFFRNTSARLSLRFADGSEKTIPILPENLRAPFRLDKVALDAEDFVKVVSGEKASPPTAIRFQVETPSFYDSSVRIRFAQ